MDYCEHIDRQLPEMTQLVEKWVNINSHTENLVGIHKLMLDVSNEFQTLQPDSTQVIQLPEYREGLFLKKREHAPFRIFLGGHLDTVFPFSHPFQSASYLNRHTLKGPGVADMKGGIVIMLKALLAFEKLACSSRIGWEIFFNPDEEIGSPFSTPFIETCAERCHLACLFEPRLENGSLVSQRKGSANFKALSKGKKAHAGRNYLEGKNAIYPLVRFITQLELLHAPQDGILINVGIIKGGEALNIIPNFAECQINIRSDEIKIMQSIEKKLHQLADKEGIELFCTSFRPPKPFDDKTAFYFQILKECGSKLGLQLAWSESGGVCDGNTFSNKGVPTIDTLGVRGGKIHTDEEFLLIESLSEHTKLMVAFLKEIALRNFHG